MTSDEHLVIESMERSGGSFVKVLAALYRIADGMNRDKIRAAWPGLWVTYREMAVRRLREEAQGAWNKLRPEVQASISEMCRKYPEAWKEVDVQIADLRSDEQKTADAARTVPWPQPQAGDPGRSFVRDPEGQAEVGNIEALVNEVIAEFSQDRALSEGWILADVDSTGWLEIQLAGTTTRFADDEEALKHVKLMASRASFYHMEALARAARSQEGRERPNA